MKEPILPAGVREQLSALPALPGTYIFRDAEGGILYVGKAKDLKKRVRSYFRSRPDPRTALFIPLVRDIETIVANTEKEALLLENTLIKRHRPPFNVDLKDDKSYPYFRVTVQEDFPRIEVTRNIVEDGSVYFGPFTDAGSARSTLSWLEKAFPLRRCRGTVPGGRTRRGRPCLDHQMGRCLGPCGGEVSVEEYRKSVNEILRFLKGGGRKVAAQLRRRMSRHAARQEYEAAAALRDRIRAIESVLEKQDVVGDPGEDLDVLGYAASSGMACLTCLFVRSGMIVGKKDLILTGEPAAEDAVDAFIRVHYRDGVSYPGTIVCPVHIGFAGSHEAVLAEAAGRAVRLVHPRRGRKVKLVEMAVSNARQALEAAGSRAAEARTVSTQIKTALKMSRLPLRIECIDVSHTSGRETYGSLVVWERGQLKKDHYRLFAMRGSHEPGDDYAALRELVIRRFSGSLSDRFPDPDLLLVDGGKGQLRTVVTALEESGVHLDRVAAIAKGSGKSHECLFIPDRANPVSVARHAQAYHLLLHLRDEAHRFAITSHRRARGKGDLMSVLESVSGIGPARRKTLLSRYRSLDEIRAASAEEIAGLRGFNRTVAARVKEVLK